MNTCDRYIMDWDQLTDVLEIKAADVLDENLINVDSLKVPGMVKRLHRLTGDCAGFTIHDFSLRFPIDAKRPEGTIKELLIESMRLTTESDLVAFKVRCTPSLMSAPLPVPA